MKWQNNSRKVPLSFEDHLVDAENMGKRPTLPGAALRRITVSREALTARAKELVATGPQRTDRTAPAPGGAAEKAGPQQGPWQAGRRETRLLAPKSHWSKADPAGFNFLALLGSRCGGQKSQGAGVR